MYVLEVRSLYVCRHDTYIDPGLNLTGFVENASASLTTSLIERHPEY